MKKNRLVHVCPRARKNHGVIAWSRSRLAPGASSGAVASKLPVRKTDGIQTNKRCLFCPFLAILVLRWNGRYDKQKKIRCERHKKSTVGTGHHDATIPLHTPILITLARTQSMVGCAKRRPADPNFDWSPCCPNALRSLHAYPFDRFVPIISRPLTFVPI